MNMPKIFSMLAAIILLVTGAKVSANQRANFVEGVDWTRRVITVTGTGLVPKDAVNYTQAKGLAASAAKADAYRKLGEIVNGVHVDGETTVEKMRTTYEKIQMRVSATIKGAKVISETFMSDGSYRVVMQMPLFGVSNSLAGAVFDKTSAAEPFPDPIVEIAPTTPQYNRNTPVSKRIDITAQTPSGNSFLTPPTPYKPPLSRLTVPSVDTIILQQLQANSLTIKDPLYKPVPVETPQRTYDSSTVNQMAKKSVEDYASFAEGSYTGLIVDCRGLRLQPVMSPVIKNTKGTRIYGHKNLDIDRIIREGMADYIDDTEHVERAGSNPLVVKAVSLENFNSNPVLTVPDSNRVLIENHATQFLKELKVVFFFD